MEQKVRKDRPTKLSIQDFEHYKHNITHWKSIQKTKSTLKQFNLGKSKAKQLIFKCFSNYVHTLKNIIL
jgi:hypothetical protein